MPGNCEQPEVSQDTAGYVWKLAPAVSAVGSPARIHLEDS